MPVAAPSATGAGRAAFAAVSVASAVLLQSFCFHDPHWVPLLLAEGLMVLAAFRPFDGLLVFAALAPLAGVIITAIDAQAAGGTRFVEVLALAFITGASARRAFERGPFAIPPRLAWTAAPLVVLALASGIVQAAVLSAEQPALWRGGPFPIGLIRDDLILGNSLSAALQFAEGLLLVLLALECCGADPRNRTRAARMMIVAATAAASLNVLRVTTAAMRQDHFWRAVGSIATQFRVNIHFSDWNAAGSYFAMVLLVAAAFAIWRGARYAVPIVLLAAALWLTGSRTAFGAVTLVALALGAIDVGRRGERRASVLAALAVLVLLAGAGWTWYPEQRNDAASFSLSSRLALARAGVRMAADHPVFGVGVQQYYQLSDDYAGDLLASFGRVKENAHNYFVQVLAELGVPGFALFVAVLVLALRAAWPGPAAPPSDWGLPAGLFAYLLTCLGGHPLLTPEAAYPFWIALGIAAAAGTARAPAPRWLRWTVSVAILLVAASLPIRAVFAVRHARLDNTAIGLSAWQRSGDDVRFRWTEGRGTFYVSAAAAAVSIRLRLGPDAPGPMLARVSVNGRQANQVQITSADDWKKVRFVRAQGVRADFVRVDVEAVGAPPPASPAARVLAIGQPEMLWSSDAPANDVPMSADLDGDGKADLVLWSAGTARWRWLTSSTGYDDARMRASDPVQRQPGGTPLLGDVDGDGKADLVVWRGAAGQWQWLGSSTGYRQGDAGSRTDPDHQPGDVPLLGDVDGDGRADLILWRASARTWHWLTSSSGYAQGGSVTRPPISTAETSSPLAADADGSRRAALMLWTAGPNGARVDWTAAPGTSSAAWAWADRDLADIPFAADVDGDRRADPIAWRPGNGMWSWLPSTRVYDPAAAGATQWGSSYLGDIPMVADLDGDGLADFLVWRATTRTWYWTTSASGYQPAAARVKPWKF